MEQCRVCGGGAIERFCTAFDRFLNRPEPVYDILRCRACGFGWTSPPLSPEEIGAHYPSAYLGDTERIVGEFLDGRLQRSRSWRNEVDKTRLVERHVARGRLLDVGCAEGKFLWALDASRWERCGVERDAAVVALVQGRIPGLHLVAGDEASAELEAESFDAVTCWHVFEHLHDPPVVMARLARLLRPGGRLFLSLPNLASLQAALFRRHWYPFDDVPRHLYHFSPRSLELLGARSGLAPAGRHFFSRRLNFHSLRHSAAHWAEARFGSRRPYRLLKPALALFPLLEAATGRPGIITVVLVKGGVNSEG